MKHIAVLNTFGTHQIGGEGVRLVVVIEAEKWGILNVSPFMGAQYQDEIEPCS